MTVAPAESFDVDLSAEPLVDGQQDRFAVILEEAAELLDQRFVIHLLPQDPARRCGVQRLGSLRVALAAKMKPLNGPPLFSSLKPCQIDDDVIRNAGEPVHKTAGCSIGGRRNIPEGSQK